MDKNTHEQIYLRLKEEYIIWIKTSTLNTKEVKHIVQLPIAVKSSCKEGKGKSHSRLAVGSVEV